MPAAGLTLSTIVTKHRLTPLPLPQVPQSTYKEPKEQKLLQIIKTYNRRTAEVATWDPYLPTDFHWAVMNRGKGGGWGP